MRAAPLITAPIAIIVLTPAGLPMARRVRQILRSEGDSVALYGRRPWLEPQDDGAPFDDPIQQIGALFVRGAPIIGLCAAGVLVRAVAPHLRDKHSEPPVLSVAADGGCVVPLLGGHHGANHLARRLAAALGGTAAITTASDSALGFALDAPPPGWRVANPAAVKPVTAALLARTRIDHQVEAGGGGWPPLDRALQDQGNGQDLENAAPREMPQPSPRHSLRVTDRRVPEALLQPRDGAVTLVLHPPVLALGVGCERDAAPEDLSALALEALAEADLALESIAAIGSLDLKVDEPAVRALAEALNRPLRVFDAQALNRQTPFILHPSEAVRREVGCPSVAEAAALALAGPEATLVIPKRRGRRCTVAVARAPAPIDPARWGRAPGRLFVVGLGPGQAAWRTAEADAALDCAQIVIGYGLYLDLIAERLAGKRACRSPLGAEEERVRQALTHAAAGQDVALVCSGDPGVYALATLTWELIEREQRRDWNGVSITVMPGVSAMQAAAARAGAPLGHDFCAISLSDLLTPRAAILRRLEAAAAGDFVTALYNPQSARRRALLPEAQRLFLSARPAQTPVIIARAVGRAEEHITTTTLADLDPARVDMLSLVIIGNRETRRFDCAGRTVVYTPRGYGRA